MATRRRYRTVICINQAKSLEPLHCDDKQVQRKYLEPETGILCIAIDLTFDEYPPTSGGHDSQEATIGSHHILRDIKRSTFHPKEEDYDISDANGSTSNETSMTRLSAQDFLKSLFLMLHVWLMKVKASWTECTIQMS